jgi:hypothetical protein
MNQTRVSLAARDQLINQIIHQGKAKRNTLAIDTYSSSLSVKGYKLRPVPGSRDKQLNQSQGAGVPKWRARQRLKPGSSPENQWIRYPLRRVEQGRSVTEFWKPQAQRLPQPLYSSKRLKTWTQKRQVSN